MTHKDKVREFIVENFLFGDAQRLSDDKSFLTSAIVDSTGILELVAFVEESFGIKVEDAEMLPENFDSLNNISAYLSRKLGA